MKNKKVYLILIGILFLSVVLCLFILKDKNDNIVIIDNEDKYLITGDKFNLLNEYNKFFTIQKYINLYYENINNTDYLEKFFIEYKEESYENASYTANKIYQYNIDNISMYFVSGYVINQSYVSELSEVYDNIVFFVIVQDNLVNIKKIDSNNVDLYLTTFNYNGKIKISDGLKYEEESISEINVISYYISNFMNLLINKPINAYTYLSDVSKKYYDSFQVFSNDIYNIYDKLTPIVLSYSIQRENDLVVYNVVDDNGNEIIIYEKGIMDYNITIN